MIIQHNRPYKYARKLNYPTLFEQLEAIWAALEVNRDILPPKTIEILDKILAVNEKHPENGLNKDDQNQVLPKGKISHIVRKDIRYPNQKSNKDY